MFAVQNCSIESGSFGSFVATAAERRRRTLVGERVASEVRRHRTRRAIANRDDLVALDPGDVGIVAQRRHRRFDVAYVSSTLSRAATIAGEISARLSAYRFDSDVTLC